MGFEVRDSHLQLDRSQKKSQYSPPEWTIVLFLILVDRLKPQEGTTWGMGFVIHGGVGWQKIAGQGWSSLIKWLEK